MFWFLISIEQWNQLNIIKCFKYGLAGARFDLGKNIFI